MLWKGEIFTAILHDEFILSSKPENLKFMPSESKCQTSCED